MNAHQRAKSKTDREIRRAGLANVQYRQQAEAKVQQANQDLAAERQAHQETRQALDRARQEIGKYEAMTADLEARGERLDRREQLLDHTLEEAGAKLTQRDQEIVGLKKRLDQALKEFERVSCELAKLQALGLEAKPLRDRLQRKSKELEQANGQIRDLKNELARIRLGVTSSRQVV